MRKTNRDRIWARNGIPVSPDAQAGLAIVEFALVIGFILIICTAGLELAQSLRLLETTTTFSRELASMGYRSCAGGVPSEHEAGDFDYYSECLAESAASIRRELDEVIPGNGAVLSLYEYVPAEVTGGAPRFERRGAHSTAAHVSRFASNVDGSEIVGNIDNGLARSHRWIVISELYVPYGLKSPLLSMFRPEYLYDVTFI